MQLRLISAACAVSWMLSLPDMQHDACLLLGPNCSCTEHVAYTVPPCHQTWLARLGCMQQPSVQGQFTTPAGAKLLTALAGSLGSSGWCVHHLPSFQKWPSCSRLFQDEEPGCGGAPRKITCLGMAAGERECLRRVAAEVGKRECITAFACRTPGRMLAAAPGHQAGPLNCMRHAGLQCRHRC